MSTPTDSPEPSPENVAVPPSLPGTPTAPQPAVPLAAFAAPPPGTEPFAPVARAPKTPWVNPAKRTQLAMLAILGALVFGGGGLLVGHVVTHHRDLNGGVSRMFMHPRIDGPGAGPPGFGRHRGQLPIRPREQFPSGPAAPAPTPSSSTKTS